MCSGRQIVNVQTLKTLETHILFPVIVTLIYIILYCAEHNIETVGNIYMMNLQIGLPSICIKSENVLYYILFDKSTVGKGE